jgi:hypothetical protein
MALSPDPVRNGFSFSPSAPHKSACKPSQPAARMGRF